jgi:hypothetical protein
MIFASGVVLFTAGVFTIAVLGTGNPYVHNKADVVGVVLFGLGFLLAAGSVLAAAARFLP